MKKWIFKYLIRSYYLRIRLFGFYFYFYPDMPMRASKHYIRYYTRPIFIWRRKEQTHFFVDGRYFTFKRITIFGKVTHFVSVSPRKWLNAIHGRETYAEEIEQYNLTKDK